MHKKRIKGKSYFYTSYRDETGKVKTKYLGRDYSSAKLEEKRFSTILNKKVPEPNYKIPSLAFLILFFGLLISISYFLGGGITGFSTINTASQEDFDEGVYSQTFYNTSDNFIQLNISEGYTAGNYTSKVIDASKAVTWDNISWIESVPYGEELPNNQEDELASGIFGGANMTGNVLLMHFNNDSSYGENSTHVFDFSGNQNNGTAYGGAHPNLTDYKLGSGAFEFDGDNDYVDIPDDDSIDPTSAWTLSAWIKRNDLNSQDGIIEKYDWSAGKGNYGMRITTGNQLSVFVVDGTDSNSVTVDTVTITTGTWYYVVGTFDDATDTLKAYINGELKKTNSAVTISPPSSDTSLKIGARGDDVTEKINGTIDEVAIWNRSLSAEEILNNYKRGALRLNLTVRSCDDATCDTETWRDVNDTSPQNLSVSNNRYFQYRFGFETDDSSFSPELYNVTINNNAVPEAEGISIYNATAHFNTSLFGYANYTDAEFDDSNGTSQYKWFVNGILNKTGNTSQLLLCHFNNNYTCEEGETASITQYHREFNTSEENINITLTEKNSSIIYFNIPKTAIITEAFMNISGYLTSPYDLLQYDSQINATYKNPGTSSASKHYIAGVYGGVGIDSWFLLNNTPAGVNSNIISIRYGNTFGTPTDGNFSYNIKLCPANIESLSISQTSNPDDNCTSAYIDIIDTVNLSSNFTNNAGWQNFTFKDNISITFNNDYNFLVKFEFIDGDLSADRYWEMYLVDDENNPKSPTYISYNYSSYTGQKGNQLIQFYSKSRYPKGVEIYVGNDGNNNIFADDNKSFDTTNTTADFTSAINTYLSTCSDTYCDIPINVSSNSSGVIGLESLRVSYDHYDIDGKFLEGIPANNTYTTKYGSDNNIHNHNGTLDIWVKPYWDGDDGNEYTFFTDSDNIIQLNKTSANHLLFYVDSASISCDISTWAARTWYLITATWNQGENIYLYINGSNCASANAPISIPGLGEFIFIGSGAENNSQANSTIDDLRITGFPRESDEISNYFSENRAFFQNEIFLNSTDTQIKRDDEIIFEFTPVDSTGASGTPENSTALIISNYPPIAPILNYPPNNSYISLPNSFSWNNGTDYDKEDAMYYVLQIDDSPEFTEPVTYYNGSISETSSPTYALVDGVSEGNYSWRVFSSDLTANSSSEIRYVTLDLTAPHLILTSNHYNFLSVDSSETEKTITFFFNVSEQNHLENCTFNLNGTANPTVNLTLTHINQTENNFTQTLAFGGYNWSINCTDIANNINTTGKTILSFVAYSNFIGKGRTTNFSEIDDPSNVSNLTLEEPEYGVINFTGVDLDLSAGIDIDSYVSISFNEIKIDGAGIPELDSPANLTLFNLTSTDIYVLKDGVNCTDYTEIDSSPATYTFSITSTGTYTTQGLPLPPTPPPTPTGGSGGGGGTKTLTKVRSFAFDTNQPNSGRFVLQMKRNAPAFEKISIKNNGDLPLVLTLSHNLGTHLEISPKQFRLEPEDTRVISANFYAGNPGIHVGRIIITTDTFQKIIPITLEVRSEKIVVDSKLDIPLEYTELKQGDPLKAQVTLFNTGSIKVPIVITYLIKDLEGNIVLEEVETFDILNKKSFIKTFDTSNLKTGSYITGMNVRYKDSFATSSARFEIKDGQVVKKPIFEFKWYYIMIIISLFILIILLKLYTTEFSKVIRKKRRKLKKYEE